MFVPCLWFPAPVSSWWVSEKCLELIHLVHHGSRAPLCDVWTAGMFSVSQCPYTYMFLQHTMFLQHICMEHVYPIFVLEDLTVYREDEQINIISD